MKKDDDNTLQMRGPMTSDTATEYLPNRNQWMFLEPSNSIIYTKPEMKVGRVSSVGIDDGYFGKVKRSNWIGGEYGSHNITPLLYFRTTNLSQDLFP